MAQYACKQSQPSIVDEVQQWCLHELHDRQRSLDDDERLLGEHDSPLIDGVQRHVVRGQVTQVGEELLLCVGWQHSAKVLDVYNMEGTKLNMVLLTIFF